MSVINTELIKDTVYKLCLQAGQELSPYSYNNILAEYKKSGSKRLAHILQNAKNADKIKRPLCQDTGTVHVFLKVGNEVSFSSDVVKAVNDGVEKCYVEEFFRKSIVQNEFLSGKNTETNTPALIDVEYTTGNKLEIGVLLKGAGCDNVSEIKMLLPTTTEQEFQQFIEKTILEKAKNACPPVFVSVAVGTGAESVTAVAERAYFSTQNDFPELSNQIKENINSQTDKKFDGYLVADVKITARPHHMASLPVSIIFNCHSLRIASAVISGENVEFSDKITDFINIEEEASSAIEVDLSDMAQISTLKEGQDVLLTGEILIARDAAHKKMLEYKKTGKELPFDLADKTVFYAAPCPAKPSEIIGSMGPTTSLRMDKFLAEFPQVKATMGKGARSKAAEDFIRANNSVYFEIEGGISTLLASCFEKYETVAFKELSTEAVSLAKIKKLPAKVAISANR